MNSEIAIPSKDFWIDKIMMRDKFLTYGQVMRYSIIEQCFLKSNDITQSYC